MRASAALALLLVSLTAAAGCGGSSQPPIRIGLYGDCYGPFGLGNQLLTAGAELPFVRRGATLRGNQPTDGVRPVTVAGRRVELVLDCDFYGSTVSELAAARRLVEQRHVDILLTPEYTPDFAEQLYPKHEPAVTFVSTGLDPLPGRPNLFRVAPSWRQGSAGLGAYAYEQLGWRTAAVVGEDDYVGWSLASGFVAEFCSLGGTIVKRVWVEPNAKSWAPAVGRIPSQADGVALMPNFLQASSFFAAYRRLQPDPARHVVMSATAIAHGDRTPGITTAGFLPFVSAAPAWNRQLDAFRTAFPRYGAFAGTPPPVYASDAVELALEAIQRAGGDLSHLQQRLRAAMRELARERRVPTPVGPLVLDSHNNAVAPNFLVRMTRQANGEPVPVTAGIVKDVDAGFGGYFTASSPPDGETQPVCRKGHVPPWAR